VKKDLKFTRNEKINLPKMETTLHTLWECGNTVGAIELKAIEWSVVLLASEKPTFVAWVDPSNYCGNCSG
jgi:hypothetical protein